MKNRIYGYCRISRKSQNIERQVRNITSAYPDAIIRKEAFTGTKIEGRKEFEKILREVKPGDTIVFDSVSRMSRNSKDGVNLYFELCDKGIELIFLKEGYINTSVYRESLERSIGATGNEIADMYIETTNQVLRLLAKRQIEIAFDQAEKEVTDLRERTKEGIETARRNGKELGRPSGYLIEFKKDGTETKPHQKGKAIKAEIQKKAKDFGGAYTDLDLIKVLQISRGTYYKYKKQLIEELNA